MDLSISETILKAADSIKEGYSNYGCVDILINCGGISQRGTIMVGYYNSLTDIFEKFLILEIIILMYLTIIILGHGYHCS